MEAIGRSLSDTGVKEEEWKNASTIAAVLDGAKALLHTCGRLLKAELPDICILYCVMHRIARVDIYSFKSKRKEDAPGALRSAQKALRGAIKVMNGFSKVVHKSAKIRDQLEDTAGKMGVKFCAMNALQDTRMLRSRTRAVSGFILNSAILLQATVLSKLQPKIQDTCSKNRAQLVATCLAQCAALADYCWAL